MASAEELDILKKIWDLYWNGNDTPIEFDGDTGVKLTEGCYQMLQKDKDLLFPNVGLHNLYIFLIESAGDLISTKGCTINFFKFTVLIALVSLYSGGLGRAEGIYDQFL